MSFSITYGCFSIMIVYFFVNHRLSMVDQDGKIQPSNIEVMSNIVKLKPNYEK